MRSKHNFKQRNRYVQGLRLFKDTLPTKAKKIISKKGDIFAKTLDNWKNCYPKSFKNSNLKGKYLNIMVRHGHEVDLEYSKNTIVDKINTFFGYKVVSSIKLKTFDGIIYEDKDNNQKNMDVTKKKFSKKIISIKNKNIKNSLLKLNKVMKKR